MAEIEAFGLKFNTDKITTTHKILAGVLSAVSIVGGIGYYQSYPKWEQLTVLKEEIEKQEVDIASKENKVKNLPKLKVKLKEIEKKLAELKEKIPSTPNVAALMLDLEEITENQAVYGNTSMLNSFKPSGLVNFTLPASMKDAAASETAKKLKQLPVNIRISKITYPDFIKLLTDYEGYERTLSLENISVIPVEDEESLYTPVDVSFTLKAFLLEGN